ncbi:hypothetical protein [Carboxylicivirga sp. RSCT41]|uniref:hypothetical protein n=1 Tax=Carboxylicivirga agarovorans TaxID=3417570 RepID=UPI003D329B9F
MNKFKLLLTFMLIGIVGVNAQTVPGGTFEHTVCGTDKSDALDLKNVVGAQLDAAGGTWEQFDSDEDIGDYNMGDGVPVSNVFSLSGRPAGKYYFVYFATTNACLQEGSKVKVVVTIVEEAKDITHTISLCGDADKEVTLNDFIDPAITTPDFNDLTGLPSGTNLSGTGATTKVTIPKDYKGIFTVNYKNNISPCDIGATLTVVVNNDVSTFELNNNSIVYCSESLPGTINLSQIAGASVPGGTWSVKSAAGATLSQGVLVSWATQPNDGNYTFEYKFDDDCDDSNELASKTFTITITNDITSNGLTNGGTDQICKSDNPALAYNLLVDGLGLNIPVNTGKWEVTNDDAPAGHNLDLTNGLFEVKDAPAGTYELTYTIGSAATHICATAGQSATLTLTVGDVSNGVFNDGRIQLCVDDVENNSSGKLNLNDYIAGADGFTWRHMDSEQGTEVTDGEVAYSALASLGIGTHRYNFAYSSDGCDGQTGVGSLYVVITDELDMEANTTIQYCRPDMPGELNLNQLLGIAVAGNWTYDSTDNAGSTPTPTISSGITFKENPTVTGDQAYVLTFTPTNSGNCGAKTVKLTIEVKENEFD